METSETKPVERNRLQCEKTDRQVDEVSHKFGPSRPDGPGGSNVSTFTDGVGRVGNIVLCAVLFEEGLETDQRTFKMDCSNSLNMRTHFQMFQDLRELVDSVLLL